MARRLIREIARSTRLSWAPEVDSAAATTGEGMARGHAAAVALADPIHSLREPAIERPEQEARSACGRFVA